METTTARVLTEAELRGLEAGDVTVIVSGGMDVPVPEDLTAGQVVDMLEIDGTVEYVLEGTELKIEMKSVGTKGL